MTFIEAIAYSLAGILGGASQVTFVAASFGYLSTFIGLTLLCILVKRLFGKHVGSDSVTSSHTKESGEGGVQKG